MRKICLKDMRAALGRADLSHPLSIVPTPVPLESAPVLMLATGMDVHGCDPQGERHQRAFGQMLSPKPSKCPTVCQALY